MKWMKRELIITADDLGADEGRNAGIFEAIQAGVVTRVSVLANGPALADALERLHSLKGPKVSIGVHLNLSEGKPLSSGLNLLTGLDGQFRKKAPTQRLLMGCGDGSLEKEVAREMAAQTEALKKAGLPITHLDGHQHIHVFPAVRKRAILTAREYGIPWMRIPEEPGVLPGDRDVPERLREEARFFSSLAAEARRQLEGTGVRTTDHFRGLQLKGRITLSLLLQTLEGIPSGLTEIMVHPGRVSYNGPLNPFSGFSTGEREEELTALLDLGFRRALAEAGIALVCFGDSET
jgi:chitin disaccharide deacetylase